MYSRKVIDANRQVIEGVLGRELREHTYGEVLEYRERMRDVEWVDGVPSRPLNGEEQQFIHDERYLSRLDFGYWAARYCLIADPAGDLVPIRPWPSQQLVLDVLARDEERGLPAKSKIVLLKSRQVGGTVISEALLSHLVMFNHRTRTLLASDHPDNTLNLFKTMLRMYDNMPGWMRPKVDGRVKGTHLNFNELDSYVQAGSGNQITSLGQGLTLDGIHLTEVSTWDNPIVIEADILHAFDSSEKHHSFMVIESTGAGAKGNYFHELFQTARAGTGRFTPLFAAWYLRPSHRANPDGLVLSGDTLEMAGRVRRETGRELEKEQLAWYQLKRMEQESKGLLELFFQEVPSTIEEAFQTGLKSVFSIQLRAKVRNNVRRPIGVFEVDATKKKGLREVDTQEWLDDPSDEKFKGKLVVWEWARRGFQYVIGGDASYGIDGGDAAALQVLRVGNRWEGDEQVAEYYGNPSPFDLANVAEMLGSIYTDRTEQRPAIMAIESNPGSPGLLTQTELMRRGYENFYVWKRPLKQGGGWSKEVGWWTTPQTRPLLMETGINAVKKGSLTINSSGVCLEMQSFVNSKAEKGQWHPEHAPGYHDDRLVALFIALYVAHETDTALIAEDLRKREEERLMGLEELEARKTQKPRQLRDSAWGQTWEEMMAGWEEKYLYGGR